MNNKNGQKYDQTLCTKRKRTTWRIAFQQKLQNKSQTQLIQTIIEKSNKCQNKSRTSAKQKSNTIETQIKQKPHKSQTKSDNVRQSPD